MKRILIVWAYLIASLVASFAVCFSSTRALAQTLSQETLYREYINRHILPFQIKTPRLQIAFLPPKQRVRASPASTSSSSSSETPAVSTPSKTSETPTDETNN